MFHFRKTLYGFQLGSQYLFFLLSSTFIAFPCEITRVIVSRHTTLYSYHHGPDPEPPQPSTKSDPTPGRCHSVVPSVHP